MMYQAGNFVLHAGQRVLALAARLPQVGHFIILVPELIFFENLIGVSSPVGITVAHGAKRS